MKTLIVTLMAAASLNAAAITFMSEQQVQAALGAQNVIEISKYTVSAKLAELGSPCSAAVQSRSARAYVVKKGYKAFVYVTTGDLSNLQLCGGI